MIDQHDLYVYIYIYTLHYTTLSVHTIYVLLLYIKFHEIFLIKVKDV